MLVHGEPLRANFYKAVAGRQDADICRLWNVFLTSGADSRPDLEIPELGALIPTCVGTVQSERNKQPVGRVDQAAE